MRSGFGVRVDVREVRTLHERATIAQGCGSALACSVEMGGPDAKRGGGRNSSPADSAFAASDRSSVRDGDNDGCDSKHPDTGECEQQVHQMHKDATAQGQVAHLCCLASADRVVMFSDE